MLYRNRIDTHYPKEKISNTYYLYFWSKKEAKGHFNTWFGSPYIIGMVIQRLSWNGYTKDIEIMSRWRVVNEPRN